jgi:voltage-gated potassium channel
MRQRLDRLINHPITDLAVVALILGSVSLLIVEATLPEHHSLFEFAENAGHVITGIFVLELALRLAAMPNRRRFLRMYWLDVLAVLPVTRPLRILRVLRLLRLFRVGVLINRRLSLLGDAVRQGKSELLTVAVVVLIVVLASAIGMNLVERGQGSDFQTIEKTTWWSLYALVAGEPVLGQPTTFFGRLLALLVMLCGLGFFAMFTGIISAAMVSRLSRRMEVKEMALEDVVDHVLICGWNRLAIRVLEELNSDRQLRSKPIVLVNELESPPDLGPLNLLQERLFFVRGDHTKVDVLVKAGAERATIAILLADETGARTDQDRDARTVLAALTIEKLNNKIFTCVELLNRENREHLAMIGVEEIVVPSEYAGRIIAAASRTRGLVSMFDELLTSRYGNQFYKTYLPTAWIGKTVSWAHQEMKERYNAVLLSIERRDISGCHVQVNPPPETLLATGDQLIFIAEQFPPALGKETHGSEPC